MFRAAAAWVGPAPGSLYVSGLPLTCHPQTLALTLSRSRPGQGGDTDSGRAPPCCEHPLPPWLGLFFCPRFPRACWVPGTHPPPHEDRRSRCSWSPERQAGGAGFTANKPRASLVSVLTCPEFLTSDYRLSCYVFIRLVFILFIELKASG